jgi:hypothetical protein
LTTCAALHRSSLALPLPNGYLRRPTSGWIGQGTAEQAPAHFC